MPHHASGLPTPSLRTLQALDARLLAELRRQRLPHPLVDDHAALYQQAIAQLDAKVAVGQGHPPMSAREVALLCRCTVSCRTLGEAVACAADFCAMLAPRAGRLSLQVQGDVALFHMDSLRHQPSSAACLVDLTGLYSYWLLWSWLMGAPLPLHAVWAAHPQREDAAPLLGLFAVPVHMGQRTYGLAFDAALLARPVVRRGAELADFVADFPYRHMAAHAAAHTEPLAQQVYRLLEGALEQVLPLPSVAQLAQLLHTTPATLRRQLAAQGCSYQQLRQQCVWQAAQRSLQSTNASVQEIAAQLGFGSAAAFRRAFVQWQGVAPLHYRQQHQAARAAQEKLDKAALGTVESAVSGLAAAAL